MPYIIKNKKNNKYFTGFDDTRTPSLVKDINKAQTYQYKNYAIEDRHDMICEFLMEDETIQEYIIIPITIQEK